MVLFTRKGCMVSNMLGLSLNLGSNTSVLGFWLCWCSCALRFSDVPGLLRSTGLKSSGLSRLRHRLLIRLSPCDCVWIVLLERAFIPAAMFRRLFVGTWILVLCWRLIHSPVPNSFWSLLILTLHIFCNLVSCPYTDSLNCACNEC
jgi:hypothetical protein